MEKFALPPLIGPSAEILILGTMPGEQSILKQRYYANKGNHFWKIMFAVFNQPFSDNWEIQKALLLQNRIGLWNVLASCHRTGSSDKNITNAVANNFAKLKVNHPEIAYIFFESKAAAALYQKYATFDERIAYQTLPSTSALNAHMSVEQKLLEWQIIAKISKRAW